MRNFATPGAEYIHEGIADSSSRDVALSGFEEFDQVPFGVLQETDSCPTLGGL
ncbi:MAG: hypothetical protein ACI8XM_002889, partial [Haloarculaceae archaeon]